MILKRFYEESLAQASFLLGCSATGEAIVIDPNRNLKQYIDAAKAENLRITAVTETHIHADFVSGSRQLAARTGAKWYLSGEGGPDWLYVCAGDTGVEVVRDGSVIRVGNLRLDVLHTPGHTPEHITFILTDEPASSHPLGAFTGDFIFAGDVGRPDLLERAAGISGTMEQGGRDLYRSLQRFNSQPRYLLLWPGHGAGSACGKSLGGSPVTSLGYEQLSNWAFNVKDENEFVSTVLQDQPEPPRYFAEMKRVNKEGYLSTRGDEIASPQPLSSNTPPGADELLVDIRSTNKFAQGFITGSINIPLGRSFVTWAGSVLQTGQPITFLAESQEQVDTATRMLGLIGVEQISGWHDANALGEWQKRTSLETVTEIAPKDVAARLSNHHVLIDVRGGAEFRGGHIPQAVNVPLGYLSPETLSFAPDKNAPIIVQCQGGSRSTIAYTLLRRLGYTNIENLTGGFTAYQKAGLKVE